MQKGILVKKYGGFYFVYDNDSLFRCTYRGKHRLEKEDVFPGDYVEFSLLEEGQGLTGVVEKVLPRKNLLKRPLVANVTQLVCVFTTQSPEPNYYLLDKLLVSAEINNLEIILCLNKKDIASPEKIDEALQRYRNAGYTVLLTSAKTQEGIQELEKKLEHHLSVFAGQSGVGKSSLLNILKPEACLEVGEISTKLKAGRHTTKHVELFTLPGTGFVADTPGFSRLDVPSMVREEVSEYFPEMRSLRRNCKFNMCLHNKEPGCAVSAAVERGEIDSLRYRNYIALLHEVIAQERSF